MIAAASDKVTVGKHNPAVFELDKVTFTIARIAGSGQQEPVLVDSIDLLDAIRWLLSKRDVGEG